MNASGSRFIERNALGLALFVLGVIVALIYSRGLWGGFALDDGANLTAILEFVRGERPLLAVVFENGSGVLGRPLSMLSFALDGWLFDGNLAAMKAVNVALHLLCGGVLFLLAQSVWAAFKPDSTPAARRVVALFVTAVWLLHPLHSSTVLYLVQRMTQLSALFTLIGLYAYVRHRQHANPSLRATLWLLGAVLPVLGLLAVLSKENGALLFALLAVCEIYLFRLAGTPAQRRALLVFFGITVALPSIAVVAALLLSPDSFLNYSGRTFTLQERLLTQSRVLLDYLAQIVLPDISRMGVYQDDYVKSVGLFSPPSTFLAIIALALMAGVALAGCFMQRFRSVGFCLAFFFVGHALESTVIALELYFEHRNYLPSVGIVLLLALALDGLLSRPAGAKFRVAVAVILCMVLGGLTFLRADIWRSERSLLEYTVVQKPNSVRLNSTLAMFYAHTGSGDARKYLDRAMRLSPRLAPATRALWRLILACQMSAGDPALEIASAFQGEPGPRSTDPRAANGLEVAWALFSTQVRDGKCRGLPVSALEPVFIHVKAAASDSGAGKQIIYIQQAYNRLALDDLETAVKLTQTADLANPAQVDAAVLRADILRALGRHAEAKAAVAEIRQRLPLARPDLAHMLDSIEAALAEPIDK